MNPCVTGMTYMQGVLQQNGDGVPSPFAMGAVSSQGSLPRPWLWALGNHPTFPVWQSPLPAPAHQWPGFPVYHQTPQSQCSNGFEGKETNQARPAQAENISTEQDIHAQTAAVHAADLPWPGDGIRCVFQKSPSCGGRPPAEALFRSPPRRSSGVADKMRGGKGSTSPGEFWKSYEKNTHFLGEVIPEHMAQPRVIYQRFPEVPGGLCGPPNQESGGMQYGPSYCEDITNEQRFKVLWDQMAGVVGNRAMRSSTGLEVTMGEERSGYRTVPDMQSPFSVGEARGQVHLGGGQRSLQSDAWESSRGSQLQQERQGSCSMAGRELRWEVKVSDGEGKAGSPESRRPLDTQGRNVDEAGQCCSREADEQSPVLGGSGWRPEVDREPRVDTEPCGHEADADVCSTSEVASSEGTADNSWGEYSWITVYRCDMVFGATVDEAIQCDLGCSERPHLIGREPSCSDRESEEEEDDIEGCSESEQSYEVPDVVRCDPSHTEKSPLTGHVPPGCDSQSGRGLKPSGNVSREVQCDLPEKGLPAAGQGSPLHKEQMSVRPATVQTATGKRGSDRIRSRRRSTGEEVELRDECEEAREENLKERSKGTEPEAFALSPSGEMVYVLKSKFRSNSVLPGDLEGHGDGDAEGVVYEVEHFEEVPEQPRLIVHKGRLYREVGRVISWEAEHSLPPQFSFSPAVRRSKLECGTHASIPVVSRVKGKEGCAGTGGRFQKTSTMAKHEDLQSRVDKAAQCEVTSSEDPNLTAWETSGTDLEPDMEPELCPGEDDCDVQSESGLTRAEGPRGSLEWCPLPVEELTKAFSF